MRPTLPLAALLALTLLTSACTSETAATDECSDPSCDWQFGESEPDAGADALDDSFSDDVDVEDPHADWQPPEQAPFPEQEVVIELAWERLDSDTDTPSTFDDYYSDLDLHYCDSREPNFSAAGRGTECTSYDNRRVMAQAGNNDQIPLLLRNDSTLIGYPEYVVHDVLPSGLTHIVAGITNPQYPLRVHARVYLDGERVWERSTDVDTTHSYTFWYAGSIAWDFDLNQPAFYDPGPCDATNIACSEDGEFHTGEEHFELASRDDFSIDP